MKGTHESLRADSFTHLQKEVKKRAKKKALNLFGDKIFSIFGGASGRGRIIETKFNRK